MKGLPDPKDKPEERHLEVGPGNKMQMRDLDKIQPPTQRRI